jgi:hypothetical protein
MSNAEKFAIQSYAAFAEQERSTVGSQAGEDE